MKNSYVPGCKQILLSDNQYVIDSGGGKLEYIQVQNEDWNRSKCKDWKHQ